MLRMTRAHYLVLGMIVFGSINTVVRKAQMVTCTPYPACTSDPTAERFDKPWIGNLFMFLGEILLFTSFMFSKNRARAIDETRLLNSEEGVTSLTPRNEQEEGKDEMPAKYFLIPASLDVIGSGLSGVSMLFISASVWQILRGSMVLFTAFLSVVWLKRKLTRKHMSGLMLATAGLALVGMSALLDAQASTPSSATLTLLGWVFTSTTSSTAVLTLGVGLTVISQFCSAVQVVVEEMLLKSTAEVYKLPAPERVVAYEGMWGVVIMTIVLAVMQVVPGEDHGSFENSIDSLNQLSGNSFLISLVLIYCISIALFNLCGMSVSKYLSSLDRTLIDSLRSVVVWSTQLVMWYGFSSITYGVEWTENSWIQLCGFCLLVAGTVVYNGKDPSHQITRVVPATSQSNQSELQLLRED